uniref:Uncharacterized protein n=1 Tax=Rhizophora mucronata TaxID=61149 RepID=A0A2P2NDE4_RHIMU
MCYWRNTNKYVRKIWLIDKHMVLKVVNAFPDASIWEVWPHI